MAGEKAPDATAGDLGRAKALRWAAGLGLWSVACGFAVFLYLLGSKEHGWQLLAGAVVVAGIVALLTECVKDLVREGEISSHQGVSAPSRIVVAALMMGIFELFVGAWHYLTAEHEAAEAGIRDTVLGPVLAETTGTNVSLLVLAAVWLFVGAVVARQLAALVFDDEAPVARDLSNSEAARRAARGAGRGILVGALAPVVLVLGYVLVVRTLGGLYAMLFDHGAYARHLDKIDRDGGLLAIVCKPVRWLDAAWTYVPWAKAGTLGVLILRKAWKLVVGAVVVAVTLPPLLGDLPQVASLLGFAALVWALPGAALGALLPYLRRPSAAPRAWGRIALAAAGLLVLLTLLGSASAWSLLPAGLLVATGILFHRKVTLEDWWPLLALSVGLLVGGVSLGLQRMTFLGVFTDFLAVNSLPTVEREERTVFAPPPLTLYPIAKGGTYRTLVEEANRLRDADPAAREAKALALIEKVHTASLRKPEPPPTLVPGVPGVGGRPPGLDVGYFAENFLIAQLETSLRNYVEALRKVRAESDAVERARERWEREGTARDLQVALAGSVGFWVTLALLAAWSIRRRREGAEADHAERGPGHG